jgi:hypothetical protein
MILPGNAHVPLRESSRRAFSYAPSCLLLMGAQDIAIIVRAVQRAAGRDGS